MNMLNSLSKCLVIAVLVGSGCQSRDYNSSNLYSASNNYKIINGVMSKLTSDLADVGNVEYILDQYKGEVKIFSTTGGDPAMNGVYLKLAVYDMAKGWIVFEIDNLHEYKLQKSPKKGILSLTVVKDIFLENGEIGSEKSNIIINIENARNGSIKIGSETIKATEEESFKRAANVNRVELLMNEGAKIFSTASFDPLPNGTHLNLAVFNDSEHDYFVFPIANVSDYKLQKSQQKGVLKVEVTREIMVGSSSKKEKSVIVIKTLNSQKGTIEIKEHKI